jgi:nucleoside-diphosphate-sugar epimerase
MCASILKVRHDLDWQPEIPLETGISENVEWMRKQGII